MTHTERLKISDNTVYEILILSGSLTRLNKYVYS